jgi:hypothetical protein
MSRGIMTTRVTVTEDTTIDVQNWRRYGTYVRAGQIVTLKDADAAELVRQGKGRILEQPSKP